MDRLQLRAEKFAELVPTASDANVADLSDILRNYVFGNLFHRGQLTDRQREMITLTVTTTAQIMGELRIHIGIASRAGLTQTEIYECITQCAPYIGFPKTLAAQAIAREGFEGNQMPPITGTLKTVTETTRISEGKILEETLFGDSISQIHLPNEIHDYITHMALGEFLTRDGLDLKTRLMLALCSVTVIGASKEVIAAFVKANLNVGNSKSILMDAITHCTGYAGFPLCITAYQEILKA